jgi:hypothetical protein
MRAEDKLGYQTDERTRFRVRVELNDDLSGNPRIEWVRGCHSLEEAQRGYISLRDASGYGASQIGFGQVFDQAGQLIAHISYNGRLWAPSLDGGSPWRPGVLAIAEAPEPESSAPEGGSVRDLLTRLANMTRDPEGPSPEASATLLRDLASRARTLLEDPRNGLTDHQVAGQANGVQVWAGGPRPGMFTHGPRAQPDFISALNEGDLLQGFNDRGDVLTEGVKTGQGIAWRRVHHTELERARGAVADLLYETVDLNDLEIVDCSGWETAGDTWQRSVFIAGEDREAPSLRGTLVVSFHDQSDAAASLHLDGEELLIPAHNPDYPKIEMPGTDESPEP